MAHRTAWSAAWGVIAAVFGGATVAWLIAGRPVWPLFIFAPMTAVGIYGIFAPLLGWWPWWRLALRAAIKDGRNLLHWIPPGYGIGSRQIAERWEAWQAQAVKALEIDRDAAVAEGFGNARAQANAADPHSIIAAQVAYLEEARKWRWRVG